MASVELLEQRAHVLATVVLTRHPDVVVSRAPAGSGLDLLVEIAPRGTRLGRTFGIELKAVLTQQRVGHVVDAGRVHLAPALRTGLKRAQAQSRDLPYPLLFIVFAMDTDRGFHGWLREPRVRGAASLLASPAVEYASEWTARTHEIVVGSVNDWYDARRDASPSQSPRRKAG
jgi:hypothetical protein